MGRPADVVLPADVVRPVEEVRPGGEFHRSLTGVSPVGVDMGGDKRRWSFSVGISRLSWS